jgi:cytoskeletal protein RodZ
MTLAQVQAKTRISARFLEALESGEYSALPTPVHVRGYLRNYARFLGLDPEPLLKRYELSQNRRPSPVQAAAPAVITPSTPLPSREDQVFYSPVNVTLGEEPKSSDTVLHIAIIIALLVAVVLVANRFIPILTGRGDGTEALTENLNAAVSDIINSTGAEATLPAGDPLLATEPITSTSRNEEGTPVATVAAEITPEPTPTQPRPPLPATMETVQMRLEITERAWMQVTVDGEVVFEGLARAGEAYEWEAQEEARLLSGNAAGVFVTINGVALGKLGERGQVRDESWRITG